MNKQEAQRRALLTFARRFGASTMPLEFRKGKSDFYGDLVCVFDPEDGTHVGYAYEGRNRLVQVLGPTERKG